MGWIKLDRKLLDHWIWQKKPFSEGQAWVDLLLLANHEDRKFISGSQLIDGKRGCVYKSVLFLSHRWGWDRKKVKRFLDALQLDGMITQNSTAQGTTITIWNYCFFQNSRASNGHRMGNQKTENAPTNGTPQTRYSSSFSGNSRTTNRTANGQPNFGEYPEKGHIQE